MMTEHEELTEAQVELAERYARALETIEEAAAITEAEVELAELYARILERIEQAKGVTPEAVRELVAIIEPLRKAVQRKGR